MVENILSLDLDNFALYVTLRETVSGNGNLEARSLEKGCKLEETETNIFLHVSNYLNNGQKSVVKTGDTYIVTLLRVR